MSAFSGPGLGRVVVVRASHVPSFLLRCSEVDSKIGHKALRPSVTPSPCSCICQCLLVHDAMKREQSNQPGFDDNSNSGSLRLISVILRLLMSTSSVSGMVTTAQADLLVHVSVFFVDPMDTVTLSLSRAPLAPPRTHVCVSSSSDGAS